MVTVAKFGTIRPDVKSIIDNVVVPILVREYLQVLRSENRVAVKNQSVQPYTLAETVLAEKVAI